MLSKGKNKSLILLLCSFNLWGNLRKYKISTNSLYNGVKKAKFYIVISSLLFYSVLLFCFVLFWDMVLPCNTDWPRTHRDPTASYSGAGMKVVGTVSHSIS